MSASVQAAGLDSGGSASGDVLKCTLSLTIDGTDYSVPGGQIKSIALDALGHGFSGGVEFVLADNSDLGGSYTDTLYDAFVGEALIAITLAIETPLVDEEPSSDATPLELSGLVTERSVVEYCISRAEGANQYRRYAVRFVDPAQLVWRQHFPCALYTEKTWQDVLDEHCGELVDLTSDWSVLTEEQPHVFLGHEPGVGAASFYDFVVWLAATRGGYFTYDYAEKQYRLTGEKPEAGPETMLHAADFAQLRLQLPVVARHGVRLHNTYSEQAETRELTPEQTTRSIEGITHDYLLRTPIADQVDAREELEQARLDAAPGPLLHLKLARWPTSPLGPGSACPLGNKDHFLAADLRLPALFSEATTRVRSLHLNAQATAQELDADYGNDRAAFILKGSVVLELDSEAALPRIAYTPPTYPRLLEGKVVSEEGEDEDETYQIYEDEDTSAESYKVKIPLFEDQEILVDFQPLLASGHFYFPAYKNARVLVAVDLDRAWLVRYLDWRAEARLPAESQGNQLLVGKTPQNGASLRHEYEDDAPVLRIKRTNDKDTQLIEIAEGRLFIQVKEES